jgi:hypothetical protein
MTVFIGTDDKFSEVSYCAWAFRRSHSKISLGEPDLGDAV